MDISSTKKKRGRPSKGLSDYGKVSARLTDEQYRALVDYAFKHNIVDKKGRANPSEVVRLAVENLVKPEPKSPSPADKWHNLLEKYHFCDGNGPFLWCQLGDLIQTHTFDALMEEVFIRWHGITSDLWQNVAYNPDLYKTNEQKELLAKELREWATSAYHLFTSLADRIANQMQGDIEK